MSLEDTISQTVKSAIEKEMTKFNKINNSQTKKKLFDKVEASEYLGISKQMIEKLIYAKQLAYRKVGVKVMFSIDDLEDYISKIKVGAVA